MHNRLATTDIDNRLVAKVSRSQRLVADRSLNSRRSFANQSPTDFMNMLAVKSSATSLPLIATEWQPIGDWSPTGCSVSFNRRLSCHPDIISPQALKVCTSWGKELVKKKTAVPNRAVKILLKFRLLILMLISAVLETDCRASDFFKIGWPKSPMEQNMVGHVLK